MPTTVHREKITKTLEIGDKTTYPVKAGSKPKRKMAFLISITLRITGWQWSAAELPVRVNAVCHTGFLILLIRSFVSVHLSMSGFNNNSVWSNEVFFLFQTISPGLFLLWFRFRRTLSHAPST